MAAIRFIASHGDPFELFEFAEEILDQMPPFVDFFVDLKGDGPSRMLGDDDLRAAFVETFDNPKSKALSAINPSKARSSINGVTPTVSKRCPGKSSKRTRLPSASVRARIFVVIPPFDLPMAWL